jgi:uncharacterized OB-fold protein
MHALIAGLRLAALAAKPLTLALRGIRYLRTGGHACDCCGDYVSPETTLCRHCGIALVPAR